MIKKCRLPVAVLAFVSLLLVSGCSGSQATKPAPERKPLSSRKPTPKPAKAESEQRQADAAAPSAGSKKRYAVIETAKGRIVFELYPQVAPRTVESFVQLASKKFFDGIKFHRVVPGFVIQGGDPLSKNNDPNDDGTGGPGYRLKAEFSNLKHKTGTVAMARSQDVDSAGSQFYITLAPQPSLDGKYTIFGQVTEGQNVVEAIRVGDVMNRVYVTEAP